MSYDGGKSRPSWGEVEPGSRVACRAIRGPIVVSTSLNCLAKLRIVNPGVDPIESIEIIATTGSAGIRRTFTRRHNVGQRRGSAALPADPGDGRASRSRRRVARLAESGSVHSRVAAASGPIL